MSSGTLALPSPPKAIKSALERSHDRLLAVLPKHVTPGKMIEVVSTLLYRTPKLQECDPNTILAAVMEAAELGLELSRHLGEAYLVPRWNNKARCNECQLLPGYRGLVKLAKEGGSVLDIGAELVHARDKFRYARTPALDFYHEPCLMGDPGPLVYAYAYALLPSGLAKAEVMGRADLEKIRSRSQSKDSGPWVTDTGEMQRKCPIRRMCKLLNNSPKMARALELDQAEYENGGEHATEAIGQYRTRSAALAAQLAGPAEEEPVYTEGTPGVIGSEAEEEREPGSDG